MIMTRIFMSNKNTAATSCRRTRRGDPVALTMAAVVDGQAKGSWNPHNPAQMTNSISPAPMAKAPSTPARFRRRLLTASTPAQIEIG